MQEWSVSIAALLALLLAPLRADADSIQSTDVSATPCTAASVSAVAAAVTDASAVTYTSAVTDAAACTYTALAVIDATAAVTAATGAADVVTFAGAATQPYFDRAPASPPIWPCIW